MLRLKRYFAKVFEVSDRKGRGMCKLLTLILFITSIEIHAQIVQGCPGCPVKHYTGEWEEEEYKKQADAELSFLSKLDHEITVSIREEWKKRHPSSKVQIKNILDAYTLLALTDSLVTTIPLTPHACEECFYLKYGMDKLLSSETKEKIKKFVHSKFRQTYLYEKYHLPQKEIEQFSKGMKEILGEK